MRITVKVELDRYRIVGRYRSTGELSGVEQYPTTKAVAEEEARWCRRHVGFDPDIAYTAEAIPWLEWAGRLLVKIVNLKWRGQ